MPVYEYRCNDCTATYEVLRPMAERELAAMCPTCESRASMPLISNFAAQTVSSSGSSVAAQSSAPRSSGGGCCGGGCCS